MVMISSPTLIVFFDMSASIPVFFNRRISLRALACDLRRSGDHFRRADRLPCSAHHSSYDGVVDCEGSFFDVSFESSGGMRVTPVRPIICLEWQQ